ncbi:protein S100-P-like [Corythoichthys intestinalis]|uniref:protein S100-P-like n=1 Tax=Corythoichthys intestinalis TaxID=161448 RepID=UPI0025A52752|nr:protein S100-P-like [Corythoichthys intestinalis]
MCEGKPTNLQAAMWIICEVFDKYAGAEGCKDTMTKKEVKTLMENELPEVCQAVKEVPEAQKILEDLDFNKDGEMDFNEFIVCVSSIMCMIRHVCSAKK